MVAEKYPEFDREKALETLRQIDEFNSLEAEVPDALDMVTAAEREQIAHESGVEGAVEDFWDNIGKGDGGYYDNIRQNGCFSCGSHYPGNCDGCV